MFPRNQGVRKSAISPLPGNFFSAATSQGAIAKSKAEYDAKLTNNIIFKCLLNHVWSMIPNVSAKRNDAIVVEFKAVCSLATYFLFLGR